MEVISKPELDKSLLRVPTHVKRVLRSGELGTYDVLELMGNTVNASADEVNRATDWVNENGEILRLNEIERAKNEGNYVPEDGSEYENNGRIQAEAKRVEDFNTFMQESNTAFNEQMAQERTDWNQQMQDQQNAWSQQTSQQAATFATNEGNRQSTFNLNETARQTNESARVTAENTRVTAETARIEAENIRVNAENTRNQRYEAAEATRNATFNSKEALRDEAVANIIREDERVTKLEDDVTTLGLKTSINEIKVETATGGIDYPFVFVVGVTYVIKRNEGGSGVITISTKKGGTIVETIGNIAVGETIEFTPMVEADVFRVGYGSNISISLNFKNDFTKKFSEIDDSIKEIENISNNCILFDSAGAESVPYIFERGKTYYIAMDSGIVGAQLTLQTRDTVNGSAIDQFQIYSKEVIEFSPSANANYLRIGYTTGRVKVRVSLKTESERRLKELEQEIEADILGQQVNRHVFNSASGGEYFKYTFKAGNEYVVERTDAGSAMIKISASTLKEEYKLIGELAGGDKVIFVPDTDYPLLRIGFGGNIAITITAKSDIQDRLSELEGKFSVIDHSHDSYESNGFWKEEGGTVVKASSSYQARMQPISVGYGDTVYVNNTIGASTDRAFFCDAKGNILKTIGPLVSFDEVAPAGSVRMYLNVNPAYPISVVVKSAICKLIESSQENDKDDLPLLAPSPQLPANDSEDSDFNAETVTSEQIHTAFETLIDSMPIPERSNYANPRYGNRYEIVGRDATDAYDLKAYVFGMRNRYGWKNANKLYGWRNGGTVVYIDSVCPRVGDIVYSNKYRTQSGKTVTDYNSATEVITLSDNSNYTRSNADNVDADVIYTDSVGNSSKTTLSAKDKNDGVLGDATWTDTKSVTYNGKKYTRCESLDYHTQQMGTIVIWANEHGAQSDPLEPSIILYRMAKDLSVGCRNHQYLTFLKKYYKIVMIPCVNPYGINHWVSEKREGRTNGNGVNINRNYDTAAWMQPTAESKGEHAGDQAETQYVMNLVDAIGATCAIDIHCLGYVTAANEGVCAYENETVISSIVKDAMSMFGISANYWGDKTNTSEGPGWIIKQGIAGGLIEMNAGDYATYYKGRQHTANILEADYTLLLNAIKMHLYNT